MAETDDLRSEAKVLERLARQLVAIDRDTTGQPTERPAQELGHAVVRFSIALADLATAAEVGFRTAESWFPRDPDSPSGPVDDLGMERAELALLSAVVAGDVALDYLAWAELVRRGEVPIKRGRDGKLPVLWSVLMARLDAEPTNPMRPIARSLDVTLDAARDALVAHRDPELFPSRSIGTGSLLGLTLTTWDAERVAAALNTLPTIGGGSRPPATADAIANRQSGYDDLASTLVDAAVILGPDDRMNLRKAFRMAGIRSPSMVRIARWYRGLVELYLAARERESPPAA